MECACRVLRLSFALQFRESDSEDEDPCGPAKKGPSQGGSGGGMVLLASFDAPAPLKKEVSPHSTRPASPVRALTTALLSAPSGTGHRAASGSSTAPVPSSVSVKAPSPAGAGPSFGISSGGSGVKAGRRTTSERRGSHHSPTSAEELSLEAMESMVAERKTSGHVTAAAGGKRHVVHTAPARVGPPPVADDFDWAEVEELNL